MKMFSWPAFLSRQGFSSLRSSRTWRYDARSFERLVHGSAVLEQIPEGTSPTDAYHEFVKTGALRLDEGQLKALQPFERLHGELKDYNPPSKGLLSRLLRPFSAFSRREIPRGVYVYGGAGTGKSLVADIFFRCSTARSKRRVHFHQFMLDVHKRLHEKRLIGEHGKKDDVIKAVAQDLLEAGWLLCFDEFQVIDIADAMILKRLLEFLFQSGAVVVASSNRAPIELYKNGLQRDLFLPCIDLIQRRCQVHSFHPGSPDYRLLGVHPDGSSVLSTVWYQPLNDETEILFEKTFEQLAKERRIESTVLKEGSRSIEVPKAAGGIAYFSFMDLCGTPKGAADYLAIAASFHTVFVKDIPKMTSSHNELARRFITLVDVLYEQRVKLIATSSVEPKDLYRPRIWDRYNVDADTQLSRPELLLMIEDLTDIKSGHRHVPEELLNEMFERLDANHDGSVVWTEFRDYFLQYGLEIQSL